MSNGRPVKSTDPRKRVIMDALKQCSGGSKVTNVREVSEGVFVGDCLRGGGRGIGAWENLGTWQVTWKDGNVTTSKVS